MATYYIQEKAGRYMGKSLNVMADHIILIVHPS
jgi:hypothetical protein